MKLKYATKLFMAVNGITLLFRTMQVLLLTESGTGFLKTGYAAVNIIGAILVIFCLGALFINAIRAVRQPQNINCKGWPSVIVAGLCAAFYMASGISALAVKQLGWKILIVTSLLAAVMCIALAFSAVSGKALPKGVTLLPIPYWLTVLVVSYIYYTERPLRVRTVYEAFAVCFVLLFTVCFGKAVCGVNPEKNFRRMYPLGFTSCSLCLLCIIPEGIAIIFGMSEKITASPVMPLTLVAGALFTGFFTINTFKKSNTIHPKKGKKMDSENTAQDLQNRFCEISDNSDETVIAEQKTTDEN